MCSVKLAHMHETIIHWARAPASDITDRYTVDRKNREHEIDLEFIATGSAPMPCESKKETIPKKHIGQGAGWTASEIALPLLSLLLISPTSVALEHHAPTPPIQKHIRLRTAEEYFAGPVRSRWQQFGGPARTCARRTVKFKTIPRLLSSACKKMYSIVMLCTENSYNCDFGFVP